VRNKAFGVRAQWHIAATFDDRSVRAFAVKPCAFGAARLSKPGDHAATASFDAPPIGPRPTARQWRGFSEATGKPAMADRDIIIGRVINFTGAIGVLSGVILSLFGIVLLVFRRGFGFELSNPVHWFW
jgi:hypothetical protein